jgi:hypothetical protein
MHCNLDLRQNVPWRPKTILLCPVLSCYTAAAMMGNTMRNMLLLLLISLNYNHQHI